MPPNNYPFYSEEEKYVPVVQADGGQLSGARDVTAACSGLASIACCMAPGDSKPAGPSHDTRPCLPSLPEWTPMYNPTPEQAEADRRAAYAAGVPHGYTPPGGAGDKAESGPTIALRVVSELVRAAG